MLNEFFEQSFIYRNLTKHICLQQLIKHDLTLI